MSVNVAIPVWNDRVSTTFDFSEGLIVVETEQGREIGRKEVVLSGDSIEGKVRGLRKLSVRVLLCGAISQTLAAAVSHAGILIIPYVTGPVDEVLAAYLCGRLSEPRFLQPGCRPGARRRWSHRGGFCGGRGRW